MTSCLSALADNPADRQTNKKSAHKTYLFIINTLPPSVVSVYKISLTVMPDLRSLPRTLIRGYPESIAKTGFPDKVGE
jgi:hypothetical protein